MSAATVEPNGAHLSTGTSTLQDDDLPTNAPLPYTVIDGKKQPLPGCHGLFVTGAPVDSSGLSVGRYMSGSTAAEARTNLLLMSTHFPVHEIHVANLTRL